MAKLDKVFKQTYDWFRAAVTDAVTGVPAAQRAQVEQLVWQLLGILNPAAPPADPDIDDFAKGGADAESLAVAATIAGESLVALDYIKHGLMG
jgi:Holliday junction resolvasome RuvABC endonuclease subunit